MLSGLTVIQRAARERDAGRWSAAAALYAELLAAAGRNSFTFRYVVQLGNCLKEAGLYDEARAAYDDAMRIRGRDADLQLQRGHLFKLMGNTPAAAWSYQNALNLDPTNQSARLEIEQGGALAAAGVALPLGKAVLNTIWFDVTDFVNYARDNVTLSGIQRVCGTLLLTAATLRLAGYRIVPVLPDYESGTFYSARYASVLRLVEAFRCAEVSRDDVARRVEELLATRVPAMPGAGDILVIAGAFWIVSRYDIVAELRRRGMAFGIFVHDLIPIRHPEYAAPETVDRFGTRLSEATDLCDFILTNSAYVREDVRKYLCETGRTDVPVASVPLPIDRPVGANGGPIATLDQPKLRSILSSEYVLVVSTIEVRKNHALLLHVWEQLRAEFGEATPRLVFVGKWGWGVETLRASIETLGREGGWLFILNEVSDAAMGSLYHDALFTLYPSFAEGFGLPIGESLAYGTPCIASATTAMPEVGGALVRYFDPLDFRSALAAIRRPIADRDDLRQWRTRIAADFEPRRWDDFCGEFFRTVIALSEESADRARRPLSLVAPNGSGSGDEFAN